MRLQNGLEVERRACERRVSTGATPRQTGGSVHTVPQRELPDLRSREQAPSLGRPQHDRDRGAHLAGGESEVHSIGARVDCPRTLFVLTCTNLVAKLVAGVFGYAAGGSSCSRAASGALAAAHRNPGTHVKRRALCRQQRRLVPAVALHHAQLRARAASSAAASARQRPLTQAAQTSLQVASHGGGEVHHAALHRLARRARVIARRQTLAVGAAVLQVERGE